MARSKLNRCKWGVRVGNSKERTYRTARAAKKAAYRGARSGHPAVAYANCPELYCDTKNGKVFCRVRKNLD